MKKIFFLVSLFIISSTCVLAQDNDSFFSEIFDSSVPKQKIEIKIYSNSKDFLSDYGDTCEVASDGCNTIQIKDGILGSSTMKYCENIYSKPGNEKWICTKKKGELTYEDRMIYNKLKLITPKKSQIVINDFLSKYKYKLYKMESSLDKIQLNNDIISILDKALLKIKNIYLIDGKLSQNQKDNYKMLYLLKLEIIKLNK